MIVKSNAKINLGLKIRKKLVTNMHEIETVMLPVSLYDDIEIELNDTGIITIDCDNKDVPTDSTNICYKCIEEIKKLHPFTNGVQIKLIKNIPSQSGLGGGSGDGATVIKAINQLLSLNMSDEEMVKIARNVGSDIPFFIFNQPALIKKTGESIELIKTDIRPFLLLVKTSDRLPTAEVYNNFDIMCKPSTKKSLVAQKLIENDYLGLIESIENDLEKPAIFTCPKIDKAMKDLMDLGCDYVGMTGSGSCIYGMSLSEDTIYYAERKLRKIYPFVQIVQIL